MQYPNLEAAPPNLAKKLAKKDVERAMEECCGNTCLLAVKLDTTVAHVRQLIQKYKLEQAQYEAQQQYVEKAKAVVLKELESDKATIRLKAAELVLKQVPQTLIQVSAGEVDIKEIFGAK